jgi:hypothetical protein
MPASRFVRFTFVDGTRDPYLSSAPPSVGRGDETEDVSQDVAADPPLPLPMASQPAGVARMHITQLNPTLFHEQFRSRGVPLIIEGALDPSVDWELGSFVQSLDPQASYQVRVHGNDGFARTPSRWNGKSHARHVVSTTAGKFQETIRSGIAAREDCYVQADIRGCRAGDVINATFQRLSAHTGLTVHRQYGPICNMWWGPPGHTEPLHMDVTDGTLCQLHGRKRIHLFPASSWRDLYPFPASERGMSWAFARVVQTKPDFAQFPRLRNALERRTVVLLEEGEVLFIPACCAHEISGEELRADGTRAEHVLSINRFWRTDPKQVRPHMPEDSLKQYNETMAIAE